MRAECKKGELTFFKASFFLPLFSSNQILNCVAACVQIEKTNDITSTPYQNEISSTEFSCDELGKGYGIRRVIDILLKIESMEARVNGGAVYRKLLCSVKGFTLDGSYFFALFAGNRTLFMLLELGCFKDLPLQSKFSI